MKMFKWPVICILIIISALLIKNNITPFGLGVVDGQLKALSFTPNGVSTQTKDVEKQVLPLQFLGNLDNSKAFIKEVCEAYGHSKLLEESATYLHFVFKTDGMRFKDDVEFYFDVDSQKIHYRSQSRLGFSDMGLNRSRYETLRNAYVEMK